MGKLTWIGISAALLVWPLTAASLRGEIEMPLQPAGCGVDNDCDGVDDDCDGIDLGSGVEELAGGTFMARNLTSHTCGFRLLLGPSSPGIEAPEGFVMLDGSLFVTPVDLSEAEYRACIRLRPRTAALARKRLKRESLRLFRVVEVEGKKKFRRLALSGGRLMALRRRAADCPTLRELSRAAGPGRLGQWGAGVSRPCAWAVVDTCSEFGIGGVVPEPLTALLLAGGGLALLARRRQR